MVVVVISEELVSFWSLCLSALAMQRIRCCFTALLAFFLASWSVPDKGLPACFHCRKTILLAWQSDDSCQSLTLWECFYELIVWGGMTVLPSEWICRLAFFCHSTALLNCREGWQGCGQ